MPLPPLSSPSGASPYTITKFSARNNVYGYKSCNSAAESATDSFLGRLARDPAQPDAYLDACGGALSSDSHCYYYVREVGMHSPASPCLVFPIKPVLTAVTLSNSRPFTVTLDLTLDVALDEPLSQASFVLVNETSVTNFSKVSATQYAVSAAHHA